MDQAYQGQQNNPYYQQYSGQRQQQQGQVYQNQQFQGQQLQYSNKAQNFQQQNMNAAMNQYENYHPSQQPQIEEESYDSSNVNNYTGDQYQAQQQKEYQQAQIQNYYKNSNQMQQQHQNFFQDEHTDGYFDQSNNPSGQFYNQTQMNQQNQMNPISNNKQNQIYYNDMYSDGNKRDDIVSPDDSLASDINDNQPFEGYEDLQKDFKEDRVNEALDVCEQMIINQQKVRGPASFMRLFQQILKFLNNEAVNSLNQNQFEKSLFILIKSKELTELSIIKNPPSIRALTFNNFGCYYRRLQQLPKALGYLEQALRFLNSIKSRDYLGMTYLNISAVLSQMNEHYASLENAKKAVIEIHKDYQNYLNRKNYQEAIKDQEFVDICQALAIAFYNVGVEQEFFQNFEVSLINYGKACEVCEDNLGSNHRLTRRFKELFQKFNEKLVKSEKKSALVPKNHRKLIRPSSSQKNMLAKNRSFQNVSSYSNENNGGEKDQKNTQFIQSKVNPYRLSYGVKPTDFTQHGKIVYYKNTNNSQQQTRTSSANKINASKMSRPNSSKSIYPEIKQNFHQISRPLSAKFQNTPNGGFFANSLTPKINSQSGGLSRPFSAQTTKSNQIAFSQNKAPVKSNLSRPQNKNKKQTRDSSKDKEDGNQNIYDWVDSPTNSSASGGTNKKVLDNQKDFLKSIKSEAETQIQKLQQEEAELKERIQKLKQDEEEESKQRQQRLQEQKKKEEEDAARIKQNLILEEETEKKRIEELQNKKKKEQQELERIQNEYKKQKEEELERIAKLKEIKKQQEEEIEKLRLQRAREEEEKQKKLQELENIKNEEENRLKKLKESIGNEDTNKTNLNNNQNAKFEEEERIKREKEEILKKLQLEKAEKERLQQEYEKVKKEQEEQKRIVNENLLLKQEKDKLLEEIQKLQNQKQFQVQKTNQQTIISNDQENQFNKNQDNSHQDQLDQQELQKQEELKKQKQVELEKKRLEEIEKQKQIELENQRQQELEKQKQIELEKQRQIELEKQKQIELEKQKQIELEKQKQIELEKKRQEELEKQKLEAEKQKQLEIERQRQIELEKQQLEEQEKIKQQQNTSQNNELIDKEQSQQHEQKEQEKQKYQPNFQCQIIKRVSEHYNLGIQSNVLDQVIVHAIPIWIDEKHPHLRRIINLSNISEGKIKDNVAISLIQQIQISFSINSEKRKIKFAKRWSTIIDQKTFECNIRKDSQNFYYVELDNKDNIPLITSVVQKSLNFSITKAIDYVCQQENQHKEDKNNSLNDQQLKLQQQQLHQQQIQTQQKQEEQGIPEDELTVEKVKFIQGAFRDKKVKDKAKEDMIKATQEFKQQLQNRIVQFGSHKLFLQCYRQITPEKYIIQVDSLNPKQLKLPKINDQQEVEKDFIEKVMQSENPFFEQLIYLNEEKGKIFFQQNQQKQQLENKDFIKKEDSQNDINNKQSMQNQSQFSFDQKNQKEELNVKDKTLSENSYLESLNQSEVFSEKQKQNLSANAQKVQTQQNLEKQNQSDLQKEKEDKSKQQQQEDKDEYYDEDFKDEEVLSSPQNLKKQDKIEEEQNADYSFESVEDKGTKEQSKNLDLSNQELIESKLVEKKQEFTEDQQVAALKIQKNFKQLKSNQAKEVIVKKQFFSLRLNDDNGDIQLVQGECHITLQNKSYFLILLKSESIDDLNPHMTQQQKIELGKLNKKQKQQLFSNFSTLVNCNIGFNQNHLVFEDINMFINPESIHISKIIFS
ncbi:UBX domain protein, putative (macronuclear) [Tetrahymena thermophila SB210]|uniref:UBX domain protein, putative n=1 Tax=Tetrahymena thermophila (strain SB210) TaxID=312017 RepID=Q22GI2_TETTS|nr:UBX domain protein, putative [Tetrahymena thermophila SB210]EAR84349.3 UBX domain protein, putative [Tetrahymena thermophila SB210]|eukprot:XP_001032012.3 UBX domain protein, putative [Tetrahymena thermophila SB210]